MWEISVHNIYIPSRNVQDHVFTTYSTSSTSINPNIHKPPGIISSNSQTTADHFPEFNHISGEDVSPLWSASAMTGTKAPVAAPPAPPRPGPPEKRPFARRRAPCRFHAAVFTAAAPSGAKGFHGWQRLGTRWGHSTGKIGIRDMTLLITKLEMSGKYASIHLVEIN